jgi:hypothetical protein
MFQQNPLSEMHRSVQHYSRTDINIKDKICAIQYEHCITGHLHLIKILSFEGNSRATGYEALNICIMTGRSLQIAIT